MFYSVDYKDAGQVTGQVTGRSSSRSSKRFCTALDSGSWRQKSYSKTNNGTVVFKGQRQFPR